MAKQRAAYGSISPTKNGVTRVRYWGDMHDGKGYRRLTKSIRGSRRDAQMFLSQMQLAHNEDKPTMTIGDVYRQWYLPDITKRLSKATLASYLSAWNSCVAPVWENVFVADVQPLKVQKWLDTLTISNAKKAMSLLKPLMDYPARYELIDANPMRLNYIMPMSGIKHDKGVYTYEQCCQIADIVQGRDYEALFLLSAFGSCRTGEALGVMVEDVTYEIADNGMRCAVIDIERQLDSTGTVIERTKNEHSQRFVVLPEPYSERLEAICEKRGSGLLTCHADGSPISRPALRYKWIDLLKSNGIEPLPFQNLRNSWRTYMEWELHAEPDKLEKLMGHKGKTVTERHYNRPNVKMLVNVVAEAFKK